MSRDPSIEELKSKLKSKRKHSDDRDMLNRLENSKESASEKTNLKSNAIKQSALDQRSLKSDDTLKMNREEKKESRVPSHQKKSSVEDDENIETFSPKGRKFTRNKDDDKLKINPSNHHAQFKKSKRKNSNKKPQSFKERLKPVHFLIGLLALLLLSVLLISIYFFTSLSDIKNIHINGNELISNEEVMSRLQFNETDKMITADTVRAKENIDLLPIIKSVEVKRDWLNDMVVNIEEYQTIGFLQNNDTHYPILENNRVLRGYNVTPVNAPIIYYFEGEEFDRMIQALKDMDVEVLSRISEIYYRPTEGAERRIHIFMNDGQEIVADYNTVAEKMSYYLSMRQEVSQSEPGIMDLEIGSSFLPYTNDEVSVVKKDIYNTPMQAPYINDVQTELNTIKSELSAFMDVEESNDNEDDTSSNSQDQASEETVETESVENSNEDDDDQSEETNESTDNIENEDELDE